MKQIEITSINFKTGEIGFQFSDVEMTYLVYIEPNLAKMPKEVIKAAREKALSIQPITNEMLGVVSFQTEEIAQPIQIEQPAEIQPAVMEI